MSQKTITNCPKTIVLSIGYEGIDLAPKYLTTVVEYLRENKKSNPCQLVADLLQFENDCTCRLCGESVGGDRKHKCW